MFCEKCGKPLEGEQTLCEQCAAEVVETPAAEPVEAPAVQEDTFQLASSNDAPVPTPKKKKGLIAGIVAAAVVVAAGVGIALGWDSVSAFWSRTFQNPEDYFAEVEQAAISQYTEDFTQAYGTLLKNGSATTPAANAELALTVGDDLLTLVESTLAQQGAAMELDWVKEINLFFDTNLQTEAIQSAIGIGLGDNKLLTLDVILDMVSGKGYVGIPDVSKDYLYADMSAAQLKDAMAASMKAQETLIKDLPSEKAVSKMLDKYVDIVLSEIDQVEKDSKTVTIDDASQKMTVLTAKIKQKDLIKIAEKVLKRAQKDDTLKQLITAFGNYINETNKLNGSSVSLDLYQQFTNAITSALESLEDAQENAESRNYVKLKVYVDMQNTVRGHELVVYSDGKKSDTNISYLTVADGNTIYTEAELANVEITGEKTAQDDVSDGEYTLTVEDEELITVKFEDLTNDSGTLLLIPSQSVIQKVTANSGIPASLLAGNLALELTFDGNASQGAVAANILVGEKVLLGVSVSGKEATGGDITIPTNAFDSSSQQALVQWLGGASFDSVLSAMEKANVPAGLTDLAKSYIAKLQYFTNPTEVTFDQYQAMSYQEQVFFQNCFADSNAFSTWYWSAYDTYYYG